jgi:hypothetical protein
MAKLATNDEIIVKKTHSNLLKLQKLQIAVSGHEALSLVKHINHISRCTLSSIIRSHILMITKISFYDKQNVF